MFDHHQTGKTDGKGRFSLGTEYSSQMVFLTAHSDPGVDLPVYFIRHGRKDGSYFGATKDAMWRMYHDHRIALDWGTGGRVAHELFREQNGETAVTDIKKFQELDRGIGLVVAVYPYLFADQDRDFCLIGIVKPDDEMESKYYTTKDKRKANIGDSKKRAFNTIQLSHVIEVSPDEAPDLFDEMPLVTRGTIRRSRKHDELARSVYNEYL
jgi:hypothetical protein